MAIVAHRANTERRPERDAPELSLSALQRANRNVGVAEAKACLGDVVVFNLLFKAEFIH